MLLRRVLVGLGLVFVWCGGAWAQRLPGGVRPEHYSLTITPDLAKATFSGRERIEVVLDGPASAITLNAAEIEFGVVRAWAGAGSGPNAEATAKTNANAGILRSAQNDASPDNDASPRKDASSGSEGDAQTAVVTLDGKKEQATLTFARELPAGSVTLEIAYTGILNNKLRGFYLSKTKERNYGVTQFEATDARRAFPSFDEPALKATFQVSLVVDAGDTAISNTKMVSDTAGPAAGKHTVAFAPTPKMSTYLVAWLVGDFECTAGKSDGVPIRACATPDKVELTRFALDAAKWYLHYYDRYFGIKYPLKKLDMVALPDFEAGAMENFGCITYRETEMLVDKKNGGLDAKKEVATTVAHEVSHQWFGDLVTPAWWDNLWLNEGFATWMEMKAAAEWRPKWDFAQDGAFERNLTLDADAGRTTRAIRTRVETPAEISEAFDYVAYGKAGEVIGMVENWVGEEVFRKGVHAYLAAHLYGKATGEDFWDAQARASGLPVDKVMQSYIEKPGVPLLTFEAHPQTGSYPVTQSRFHLDGASSGAEPKPVWVIPVCLKDGACELVPGEAKAVIRTKLNLPTFFYANAGDKGYYRTAYAPELLTAIEANAEAGLTAPERIGLLGDRWALMRSGQGMVGEFLDLVLAVKRDASPTVMQVALGKMDTIESKIAAEDDRRRMDAVVRREFGPVYAALGGPSKHESFDHAQLRGMLFQQLGQAQDPAVLAEAERMTRQLLSGQKATDPTIADAAVSLATPKGDVAMYESVLKASRTPADPDMKAAALSALTRFQDPALVERTLQYAVSDAMRSQDSWGLIALLLERRETQDQAWDFVEHHWAEIARKSTPVSGARIVEAAGAFCSAERRDAVTSFFAEHKVASSERTLNKTVDSINDCIHLRAGQEPALRLWLDGQLRP